MRMVVGISGGSGTVYAVRLLEFLKKSNVETHVIISQSAKQTLVLETDYSVKYLESLASYNYSISDMTSVLASGSYRADGMVVIPCSMKSLSGIAIGYEDNLLLRAAAIALKERRKLVLVPRETPLTTIQIDNMMKAAVAGAIILPPMPGFYHRPKTVEDVVDQIVGKVLEVLGLEHDLYERWSGPPKNKQRER